MFLERLVNVFTCVLAIWAERAVLFDKRHDMAHDLMHGRRDRRACGEPSIGEGICELPDVASHNVAETSASKRIERTKHGTVQPGVVASCDRGVLRRHRSTLRLVEGGSGHRRRWRRSVVDRTIELCVEFVEIRQQRHVLLAVVRIVVRLRIKSGRLW